ncbi:NYN domain-containing protein [Streptomyces thermospinosisporus]|uniref:NYN domain-containing protein n=1 Tax=Streptomyces thermospinosisporus TaxID=161482 RepID=A0ABP4JWK0_9ACTN
MKFPVHSAYSQPRKAALFVDFDNIFLGLREFDAEAAEAFATRPAQWMSWLETVDGAGAGQNSVRSRRFLVRDVYLNPLAFGRYRAVFTRSGFRAIDCPPLTTQGKNSADIYMVLDIMDALGNPTRYDEFVILSGDADFTPVLRRLRAQDRWTTVVTAGLSAAALRANCDTLVTPEQLAAAALGDLSEPDEEPSFPCVPASPLLTSAGQARAVAARPAADVAAVADAIRAAVRGADRPLAAAAAAQAALRVDPGIKESNWHGTGSFRAFLAAHLGDLRYESTVPGYVLDPARHSTDDIVSDERTRIDPFLQQVSTVTGVPPLPSDAYRTLFVTLAEDLQQNAFALFPTSKRVRDRTEELGTPVPRNAINFVIKGLKYAGQTLTQSVTAEALAEAWASNVCTLCTNAQMQLTDDDRQAVHTWITGGAAGTD